MIQSSAPAKIILLGEHAVVYGQPAIAVPVSSLRATVLAEAALSGQGLHIDASDLGRVLPVSMDTHQAADDALILTARLVLEHLHVKQPDLTLKVHSEIPMASGLGSGAAVSSALARTLSAALGTSLRDDELNHLVYEVEKLHHGTPSGVDNTVVVYERPVYFIKGRPIETFQVGSWFSFLIADTGIPALTRVAVADVRQLFEAEPQTVQSIFDAIGRLVKEARSALEAGDVKQLGTLIQENHALLQQLRVSSPELDRLVDAASKAGAAGAKLSGGGRGGSAIALVTPETAPAVRKALLNAGAARVFETTVS